MNEEVLEAEAVEEEAALAATTGEDEVDEVRALEPNSESGLSIWRGEARTVAIAAAGGIVVGAATVAAVTAVSGASSKKGRRPARRGRRERMPEIVASRSFLVDVRVLGNNR